LEIDVKPIANPHKSNSKARRAPPGNDAPAREFPSAHVATAAYYRAEARGFAPGRELEDWLEAEAQIKHGEEQ
jgi:hypothetical protein